VRKWRTDNLIERCMVSHKLAARDIRARAREVVHFVHKCATAAPDIIRSDGIEHSHDTPEEIALLRKVGAESIVLLKNEGGVLPLDKEKLKKVCKSR